MNLSQILTRMYARADWGPTTSAALKTRAIGFVNDALMIMADEAPFAFVQDRLMFTTDPDVTPFSATDLISGTGTDQWVFMRDLPDAAIAAADMWPISGAYENYRCWDGRLLLVLGTDGKWRRHRIREFWSDQTNSFVSVYDPYFDPTAEHLEWRIVTRENWLPDDIIQIDSVQLYHEGRTWWLDMNDQDNAEERFYDDDSSDTATGVPNEMYRRGHWQIDGPTQAPDVSLSKTDAWLGPWPAGSFEFCFTYCWGLRSSYERNPGDILEPLWESSPSPVSALTVTTNAGFEIEVDTPDIHFMQNFGDVADIRYRHAGWYKRIYIRRSDTDTTPAAGINVSVEDPDAFYLLEEIAGYTTTTYINGDTIPDYHRRLRQVNGYLGVGLYPRPDDIYQVDLRCIRRPRLLEDDSDAPPLHQDAIPALIARSLAYFYENQGNAAMRSASLQEYDRMLFTLSKRYGDLRPSSRPIRREYARALATRSQHYRKWY